MKTIAKSFLVFAMSAVVLLSIWGYVWNIIKLFTATGFDLLEIARLVGIVIPFLGSILGFM